MKTTLATVLLLVAAFAGSLLANEQATVPAPAQPAQSWLAPASDELQTLMPPAVENKWDWAYCDDCFNELYACVDCCAPGDRDCVDECHATFRACRQNCII